MFLEVDLYPLSRNTSVNPQTRCFVRSKHKDPSSYYDDSQTRLRQSGSANSSKRSQRRVRFDIRVPTEDFSGQRRVSTPYPHDPRSPHEGASAAAVPPPNDPAYYNESRSQQGGSNARRNARLAPINQYNEPAYHAPINQHSKPAYHAPINQHSEPAYHAPIDQHSEPAYGGHIRSHHGGSKAYVAAPRNVPPQCEEIRSYHGGSQVYPRADPQRNEPAHYRDNRFIRSSQNERRYPSPHEPMYQPQSRTPTPPVSVYTSDSVSQIGSRSRSRTPTRSPTQSRYPVVVERDGEERHLGTQRSRSRSRYPVVPEPSYDERRQNRYRTTYLPSASHSYSRGSSPSLFDSGEYPPRPPARYATPAYEVEVPPSSRISLERRSRKAEPLLYNDYRLRNGYD